MKLKTSAIERYLEWKTQKIVFEIKFTKYIEKAILKTQISKQIHFFDTIPKSQESN